MGKKNPNSKIGYKPVECQSLQKEIGATHFNGMNDEHNITISGNIKRVENLLGVRLNTNEKGISEYYSILIDDIKACFDNPLSVCVIKSHPDKTSLEESNWKIIGNGRASKSGKALNILFNDGRKYTIKRAHIGACVDNENYIGTVILVRDLPIF